MPKIKSAKKALRVSRKKTKRNLENKKKFRLVLKELTKAKPEKQKKLISEAFSTIDKAAKKNIIHPNKAARLKSQISAKFRLVEAEKINRSSTKIKPKNKKPIKKTDKK